jgi:glycyl-tRNA synthetase beta chain
VPELLLELLSEEIPARMQMRAAEDLRRLVCDGLKKAGLAFDRAEAYVTPRRLALVVDGLPEKQPDVREEKRGPRVDAPEKAIHGFLKSVGLTMDQVEKREMPNGEFYFAVIERKGREIIDPLHEILYRVIWNFPWPKSMRWGDLGLRWVRPLQTILFVFNGTLLPMDIPLLHPKDEEGGGKFRRSLKTSNTTVGHRFLAPKPFKVKDFADYKAKLRKAKVMLDGTERRAVIQRDAEKIAGKANLTLKPDAGLLDENAGLVEWPVVLMGRIDEAFMDLWSDVLTTVMRHHQKYFAMLDKDGNIAPRFIFVADNVARDRGKEIIAGNERVLRARLADAKFFRDQDLSEPLESYVPRLNKLVFHAKLGTVADKTERIARLARELAGYANADPGLAERAARLCKADLVTQMVGEFPELQGIMGGRYAYYGSSQEDPAVAAAIKEHYSPLGPNDACPNAPVSVAVALADKIDSLVGFFAVDEKPTGSKDPFALRRAALGVIRLIIENGLRVPLNAVFTETHKQHFHSSLFGEQTAEVVVAEMDELDVVEPFRVPEAASVASDLLDFFADRLKVHLREKGVRHDLISAVFAVDGEDDLVRLLARVEALGTFLKSDDGENLLVAYKRAANIVRIEEKRDGKKETSLPTLTTRPAAPGKRSRKRTSPAPCRPSPGCAGRSTISSTT